MKPKFLATLAGLFLAAAALATSPQPVSGELTVAHGWVKQPDGTRKSIAGMKLPFVAVPIQAEPLRPTPFRLQPSRWKDPQGQSFDLRNLLGNKNNFGFPPNPGHGNPREADQTVYNSNFGTYGIIEGSNPSSLDDITLDGSALNRPWTTLGFGFSYANSTFSNFLIRWRIWKTNVENNPGINDFTDEIADFGVIWNQPVQPGAWYVTISITQAGVSSDDLTLFMAHQYRQPRPFGTPEDGEGPFRPDVSVVFNGSNIAPSPGFSENYFWYDWDPLDGIYENTELEMFEGSRGDIAQTITIDNAGNVNTLTPLSVAQTFGFHKEGDEFSLHFKNDQDEYVMGPSFTGTRTSPIAGIEVEANSPTNTPTSIRFEFTGSSSIVPMEVKVELWNYQFGIWVTVHTGQVGTGPTTVSAPYGGILPLSGFVNSGTPRRMRARIGYRNLTDDLPRDFNMKIDHFVWVISR